jgi:hypothetical protein
MFRMEGSPPDQELYNLTELVDLGDELRPMIGTSAEELAALIIKYHDDVAGLVRLSECCQDFVRNRYGEAATMTALKAAIGRA